MARKCKEDAEKTRQAVLESALDVFSEKGYAKATFDEIAARAGFTKGAVYWYFRNKADLIAALILEYMQRKYSAIFPNFPKGNSLENLLEYFVLWADEGRKDLRFARFNRFVMCQMEWSEAVIDRVDKAMISARKFHLEKVNQVLVELKQRGELKEGLEIDMLQHLILSTYYGIMFSSLSKRTDFDMVEMIRTGLGLLFDSIRNKKGIQE